MENSHITIASTPKPKPSFLRHYGFGSGVAGVRQSMRKVILVLISSLVSTVCALVVFWGEAALIEHSADYVEIFPGNWMLVLFFVLNAIFVYPVMVVASRSGRYLKAGIIISLLYSSLLAVLFYREELDSLHVVLMIFIGMFGIPWFIGWVVGNEIVKRCSRLHA